MSNLNNDKVMEAALDATMEEYLKTQEKLRETLNKALDTATDTQDHFAKIKMITIELKDFNDKILYLSGENPNNYPHSKGPDPYYTPPTNSTGDVDYLKDVPDKYNKFKDKHAEQEENNVLERPEIYD